MSKSKRRKQVRERARIDAQAAAEGGQGAVEDPVHGEVQPQAAAGAGARLSRAAMRAQGPGSWVPVLGDDELPPIGSRVMAIRDMEEATKLVEEINLDILSLVTVHPVEDTPSFVLSTRPSPEEFIDFVEQLKAFNLSIAPFTVPVVIDGVEVQVPVTPMKPPNIEDAGYHVIILRRPLALYEIHQLVENHSGYIKAFAVVLIGSDSPRKWHRLGMDELPSRFSPSCFIDYQEGYGSLTGIYMDGNMFDVIFDFFLSFLTDPDQKSSTKGRRITYTNFITLGESPRFPMVMQWTAEGLSRNSTNRLMLRIGFNNLIHDWGVLSTVIFLLFIALLEDLLVHQGRPPPDADHTMVVARLAWRDCQAPHEIIKFFLEDEDIDDEDTEISMDSLCGSQISLLKYNLVICNKALLRIAGFNGYLSPEDIQDDYLALKLS